MTAKEMIKYLEGFEPDSEVVFIAANPKARKKYGGFLMAVTDMGQPVIVFGVEEESDLDEEEMAAAEAEEDEMQRGNDN